MNVNKKLKDLIAESPRTQSGIGNSLGFPNPQVFSRRLIDDSTPKVDFVAAVLNELGYDLVIVPKDARLPNGSIVVDSDFEFEAKPNKSRKG
jgi:hypothetical protein